MAAQPASADLLGAMSNVQYRRGEIPEAEASFMSAKKSDPNLVDAYLGLARFIGPPCSIAVPTITSIGRMKSLLKTPKCNVLGSVCSLDVSG